MTASEFKSRGNQLLVQTRCLLEFIEPIELIEPRKPGEPAQRLSFAFNACRKHKQKLRDQSESVDRLTPVWIFNIRRPPFSGPKVLHEGLRFLRLDLTSRARVPIS